jgi:hypothetical protein
MLFLNGALSSPAVREFWRGFPYVNRKKWVIKYGEIRLTQVLTQRKLRTKVLNPYLDVAKAVLAKLEAGPRELTPEHKVFLEDIHAKLVRGSPMNPAHYFWETLVTDFRCPFLKREVITINPINTPFKWRWADVIGRSSTYDVTLILRHLQAN